jgi:hypothetical protein
MMSRFERVKNYKGVDITITVYRETTEPYSMTKHVKLANGLTMFASKGYVDPKDVESYINQFQAECEDFVDHPEKYTPALDMRLIEMGFNEK